MALPPLSIQRQGGVGRETAAVLKTVVQQATPEIKTSKKHQPYVSLTAVSPFAHNYQK